MVEVKRVPITVEHGDDTIKISTPNTTAHITVTKGKNGKIVKIANLPAPSFPAPPYIDHTQYQTLVLKHEGGEQKYEYSGTNAFTARIEVDSTQEH